MKARVIKTDESVIYHDKIYSFGDEFEIDDAIGKSLVERGYIENEADIEEAHIEEESGEADSSDEEIAEGVEMKDVSTMSYNELKAYASELGLSAKGTKDELIERINEYFSTLEEAEETEVISDELPATSMPE